MQSKVNTSNPKKDKMKQIASMFFAAACSAIILGSCSQDVWIESDLETPDHQTLSLTTRSDHPVNEGVIYLMNASGACISRLESDNNGTYTSGPLAPGDYDLYAIGSDDLALFDLPTQEEAESTAPIHPKGETMGDLLMTHQSLTLQEGQSLSLNLALDRKVLCLKDIQITQVPSEVTAVTISIAPLYPGILLDGTYDTENTPQTHTIQLDKTDADTWSKAPNTMLFPSIGTPEITVTFTLPEGTRTYQFSPSEPFASNHQVCIHGTYKNDIIEPEIPVAGGNYLGYYVVSVDTERRIAVLLRRTQENGYTSAEQIAAKAAKINKPEGHAEAIWRLPTVAECRAFLSDSNVNQLLIGEWYYCLSEDNQLRRMKNYRRDDGVLRVEGPYEANYYKSWYYRPVIDISY